MELLADAAWQWRPKATLTAADTCGRCTVIALQYSDCAVLRVRWNDNSPTSSKFLGPRTDLVPQERDLELHGHAERIICVKMYHKDESIVTIGSVSRDCVIVWHITGNARVKQSILVENLPAEPGWLTFDDTGTLVAVASDRDVRIFVIERKEVLVTLEGHLARVTRGEFHPIHHHLLITASEDRTFKIWDLAARTLWFQSSVLSAFAILSIALNPVNGDAAFGFADGSVKVFALLDGYAKELTACNVENYEADREARREKPQVISSLPPWARSENAQKSTTGIGTSVGYESVDNPAQFDSNDEDEINAAVSCPVLSINDTSSLTLQGIAPPSDVATAAAAMGSMSSAKKASRQDIVAARFFYMDKFLLSACGNLARLHQFELDEVYARAPRSRAKLARKKNDVEVLENQSRKKRVAQWSFDDMQSVTSFACVNGAFMSSVAVIAGSDRSLRVLDVGAGGGGRSVRVVRDAHSRAAHTVALPRPTCYASHPSNFYDLLLSSAPDNTTHLWDIRADNCVMRFCEHVNRVHTLGVTFSPCMRYVATGSEDRAAYIYDIRTSRRLVKLKGHTDVVTSVAFSPLHPQLATASCDGTVRFYSSEESN
ncbi:hypothetical protein JG687_00003010 [Phytophthora cactorum]|uniref:G-protein beta WD-40 repeat n=1 Tax=Phytophthora cactorum TaxID=29920 RepID=A0A8T1UST5_9STRA|nr:hypothetical protein JG687_00003010 [Phytophthora cactorum]